MMAFASVKKRRVYGTHGDLGGVKFKNKKFKERVTANLISAPVSRTIEGASSVTFKMNDPEHGFLSDPILKEKFDVVVDGLVFRAVGVTLGDNSFDLVTEDREVAWMRQVKGAKKANRDNTTRAEFVLSQVREVRHTKIPVVIKELHKEQPLAVPDREPSSSSSVSESRSGGGGLDRDAKLTVKGVPASSDQRKNAEIALSTAAKAGANSTCLVAVITTMIDESYIKNLSGGTGTSSGTFQVTAETGAARGINPRDVAACTLEFCLKGYAADTRGAIKLSTTGMSIPEICTTCQGNAAGASVYSPYVEEARNWVRAFSGKLGKNTRVTTTIKDKDFIFKRGKNENAWDSTGDLAEEVQWRRFMSAGVFYYGSEEDFLRETVVMHLSGWDVPGIDSITGNFDVGKEKGQVTIKGRSKRWFAPPGTVVRLSDDFGPMGGRYIVQQIDSDLTTNDFTANLSRPMPELPEPAAERVVSQSSRTVGGGGSSSSGGGAGSVGKIKIGSTSAGSPAWGGSKALFDQFVTPFLKKAGLSAGSEKRSYNTGSSVSDHYVGATLSYAIDFPTTSGEGVARNLAKAMGYSSWSSNSYGSFNVTVGGNQFRVQILWGSGIAHGDHIHVGIKRL